MGELTWMYPKKFGWLFANLSDGWRAKDAHQPYPHRTEEGVRRSDGRRAGRRGHVAPYFEVFGNWTSDLASTQNRGDVALTISKQRKSSYKQSRKRTLQSRKAAIARLAPTLGLGKKKESTVNLAICPQ